MFDTYVLKELNDNCLYLGESDYELMTGERNFNGFHVGKMSIKVSEERKKGMGESPPPKIIPELRRYIGLLQLFRRFMYGLSENAAPLKNLARKGNSKPQ